MGSFTKRKDLSSCCRGEGQIELHQWTSETKREELVVVKKLPAERVKVNKGLLDAAFNFFLNVVLGAFWRYVRCCSFRRLGIKKLGRLFSGSRLSIEGLRWIFVRAHFDSISLGGQTKRKALKASGRLWRCFTWPLPQVPFQTQNRHKPQNAISLKTKLKPPVSPGFSRLPFFELPSRRGRPCSELELFQGLGPKDRCSEDVLAEIGVFSFLSRLAGWVA